MDALLCTIGKTFRCQSLRKAPFYLECFELTLYLAAKHHDKTVAQHKKAVGCDKRVSAIEPRVELVLLRKDMDATPVLHIIFIVGAVKANIVDCPVFRRVNRPRDALLTQEPVEVVIGKFRKTGTGHIREFHLRLS